MTWQPIETAPRDGSWIIGFRDTGDHLEDPYVVIRWWDGIMPEEDDDLSCDETPQWTGLERITDIKYVTHWLAFEPHPDAPMITTGMDNGVPPAPSRKERGITDEQVARARAHYDIIQERWSHDLPDLSDEELDRAIEERIVSSVASPPQGEPA